MEQMLRQETLTSERAWPPKRDAKTTLRTEVQFASNDSQAS